MKVDNQIDNEFDEGFDEEIIIPEQQASSTDSDFDAGFEEDVSLDQTAAPEVAAKPVSINESRVRGAQQGLTLGFSDELSGLIAKGVDYAARPFMETPSEQAEALKAQGFTGDVGATGDQLYTEARDLDRLANKRAEEANPLNYLAGNVAAGMLLPGAGLAKIGKSAAGVTTKALANTANKTLQKLAPAAANLAAQGALAGTIAGAGASDAETVKDLTADTLQGTATGAIGSAALGLGAQGVAKSVGKGVDFLTDFPSIQKAIAATKTGFEKGKKLTGSAEDLFKQEMTDFAKDLSGKIVGRAKAIGKAGEKFIKESDGTISLKSAKKELDSIRFRLNDPNTKLVPEEVKAFRDMENLLANYVEGKQVTKLMPDMDKIAKAQAKSIKAIEDLKAKRDAFIMKREAEGMTPSEAKLEQKVARIKAKSNKPDDLEISEPDLFVDERTGKQVLKTEITKPGKTIDSDPKVTKILEDVITPDMSEVQIDVTPSGRKVAYYQDLTTGVQTSKLLPEELNNTPLKVITQRLGGSDTITPADAVKLRQKLRSMGNTDAATIDATKTGQRIVSDISKQMDTVVPQARKADKTYAAYKQAQEIAGINPDDSDIVKANKIIGLIESAVTSNSTKARNNLNEFTKTIGKNDPKLFKEMMPKLKQISEELGIIDLTSAEGFSVLGQAGGKLASLGNIAGRGARTITGVAGDLGGRSVINIGNKVKQLAGENLNQRIQSLRQTATPETEALANILESYGNKSDRAKSAIMFGLMQNPKYRNLLEGVTPDALEPKSDDQE